MGWAPAGTYGHAGIIKRKIFDAAFRDEECAAAKPARHVVDLTNSEILGPTRFWDVLSIARWNPAVGHDIYRLGLRTNAPNEVAGLPQLQALHGNSIW